MNSGETWLDKLKKVFSPPDFTLRDDTFEQDLAKFKARLRKAGISDLSLPSSRDFDEEQKKVIKEVVEDLRWLATQDKPDSQKRLELYQRVAEHYDQYFGWEEDSDPGCERESGPRARRG